MNSRIYIARDTNSKVERLVLAGHRAAAVKHCFTAELASQQDLVRLIESGVRVEYANATDHQTTTQVDQLQNHVSGETATV
jgi:hypothetical protein